MWELCVSRNRRVLRPGLPNVVDDTPPPIVRRLNWRAVAVPATLALAIGAALIGLQLTRTNRLGGEATHQINQLVEDGRADMALRHLGRYLENFPDAREMRFLEARLRADRDPGNNVDSLNRVARLHELLLTR